MNATLQTVRLYLGALFNGRESRKGSRFRLIMNLIDYTSIFLSVVLPLVVVYRLLKSINLDPTSNKKRLTLPKSFRNRKTSQSIAISELEHRIASEIVDPASLDTGFEGIGGLEEVKEALYELLILPATRPELFVGRKMPTCPKGILLYGPPGTGKTMLARATAKECNFVFINMKWSTILSKWLGESEKMAAAVFSLAHKVQPCILFIDEIDSFLRSRNMTDNEAIAHVKAQFMSLWDGLATDESSQIVIMGATNRPDDLDDAFKRRMPRRFFVDLPNVEQREAILRIILSHESTEIDFDYPKLAEITAKYSGSDLKELCRAASLAPVREFLASEKKNKRGNAYVGVEQTVPTEQDKPLRPLQLEDVKRAMSEVRPSCDTIDIQSAARNSFPDLAALFGKRQ